MDPILIRWANVNRVLQHSILRLQSESKALNNSIGKYLSQYVLWGGSLSYL